MRVAPRNLEMEASMRSEDKPIESLAQARMLALKWHNEAIGWTNFDPELSYKPVA